MHWLIYSFTNGETYAVIQYVPALLPYLISMQRDQDEVRRPAHCLTSLGNLQASRSPLCPYLPSIFSCTAYKHAVRQCEKYSEERKLAYSFSYLAICSVRLVTCHLTLKNIFI